MTVAKSPLSSVSEFNPAVQYGGYEAFASDGEEQEAAARLTAQIERLVPEAHRDAITWSRKAPDAASPDPFMRHGFVAWRYDPPRL